MKFTRRTFFKVTAVGATTLVGASTAGATPATAAAEPAQGVLVDLTKCIGCRACESACAEANGLPDPDTSEPSDGTARQTSEHQWTVVNRYETSRGEMFVKSQCMHCVNPACVAGCLTRALTRQDNGAVIWNGDKCMGCRFCMIACPFDVPKFEYNAWNPRIQKCRLCFDRLQTGQIPACVENCGGGALTFGNRNDLLELARQRIYQNPGEYVSHIYGEREVGGTGWLYISPVPFQELGFRTDLGTTAIAESTRDFLTAVPLVLVGWPAMLLALRRATAPSQALEAEAAPGPPSLALAEREE